MTQTTKKSKAFHAPLRPDDSAGQTVGCRHTQPVICIKNSMAKICAFVRGDGMCLSPPQSWKKQFLKLREGAVKKK
jgi:hypothetical protein